MSKTVHVQYFAALREQRGAGDEDVETSANTAIQLYADLQRQYQFRLPTSMIRVAINEEFSGWNTEIKSGDTVAFLPPVGGG